MKKTLNILMAEDDQTLGYLVKENLEKAGHSVNLAPDGMTALELFSEKPFDLCLLDIMMPVQDGLSLSKQIRRRDEQVSIIFLTARQQEQDKIAAFRNGADDYLVKPFSMTELLLRIDAIMRRMNMGQNVPKESTIEIFEIGRFRFDHPQRTLSGFGETKILSGREADLLKLFCENKNKLLNRGYILKEIWKDDDYFMAKTMDVFITRLRKLIKQEENIEIKNLYGTGFKMIIREVG